VFRTILVAFDGSPSAWRALREGIRLAREHEAALYALSVEEPPPPYASAAEEARAEALDLAAHLQWIQEEARREATAHGIPLHSAVARGHAAQAIVEYARQIGADLIVIGAHGHSSMLERVLGSTTDRVVDTAGCSVLVARGEHVEP
jgi:nucleotide-binding universal stress UspA family protein